MKLRALLLAAGLLSSHAHGQAVRRIPPFSGVSFSGGAVTLPDALHDQPGVLVLGFSQDSRNDVTLWGTRLANDPLFQTPISYYEIPVLASVPRLLRSFVTNRVREAVAESARPHFVPLFDHEAEWRIAAHYNKPDDVYTLLVDGKGAILWQTQGPPSDATYNALRQQISAVSVRAQPVPPK